VNLEAYLKKRAELSAQQVNYQVRCYDCHRPVGTCYCGLVKAFDAKINFVVLIHPIEYKRRVATGRMSHLCLKNSHLVLGTDFTQNTEIQKLISDPQFYSVVLFPGAQSINLTTLTDQEKALVTPAGKKLRVFVLDGTWSTAKKMLRLSLNLQQLPKICFVPPAPSNFRVRKQPKKECFSTLEAIHHTIELLGVGQGFDLKSRAHDNLLEVFTKMVDKHIELNALARAKGRTIRYRVRKPENARSALA
jgi:DTW domain-containing protein YfiP